MPPPLVDGRPPSDQELLDSFTDREKGFYKWHQNTEEERNKLDRGLASSIRFLKEQWPDPEDLNDYFKWSRKWLGRHMDRMRYQMSDEEIFERLRNTNFASSDDLARHCWAMEMSNNPLVFLGSTRHGGSLTGYAVQTSATFLWPTQDHAQKDHPNEPGLMHESLLAINLDVPIQMTGFPDPSTTTRPIGRAFRFHDGRITPDSIQSDPDQSSTSFVSAQLGELCVFVGDWEAARNKSNNDADDDDDDDDDDVDGAWEQTGFGVVVEVQSNGQPKCLWAIYNCLPSPEDLLEEPFDEYMDATRVHRQNERDDSFVFNDPKIQGENSPCYVMKMTDDLQGLGFSKELDLQVVSRREVQIVRAKSWEHGNGDFVVFPQRVADKR